MSALSVGDQLDPTTELGPLARRDLRDELHDQVSRTLFAGGRLVVGGGRPEGPGAFYPPTILAGVQPGMTAFDEELFGPVAAVTSGGTAAELVKLANRSPYGLGASIWTADTERAERDVYKRQRPTRRAGRRPEISGAAGATDNRYRAGTPVARRSSAARWCLDYRR